MRKRRRADCHPELQHYAHGLCRRCAFRKWRQENPERKKSPRMADCHTAQPHFARGLCAGCYNKQWKKENPEKHRAHRYKAWTKWYEKTKRLGYTRANLNATQYLSMLEEQRNLCGICHKPMKIPNVDHNHATGVIRGFLCGSCNLGLGHFKDDPILLTNATRYLTTGEWQ